VAVAAGVGEEPQGDGVGVEDGDGDGERRADNEMGVLFVRLTAAGVGLAGAVDLAADDDAGG